MKTAATEATTTATAATAAATAEATEATEATAPAAGAATTETATTTCHDAQQTPATIDGSADAIAAETTAEATLAATTTTATKTAATARTAAPSAATVERTATAMTAVAEKAGTAPPAPSEITPTTETEQTATGATRTAASTTAGTTATSSATAVAETAPSAATTATAAFGTSAASEETAEKIAEGSAAEAEGEKVGLRTGSHGAVAPTATTATAARTATAATTASTTATTAAALSVGLGSQKSPDKTYGESFRVASHIKNAVATVAEDYDMEVFTPRDEEASVEGGPQKLDRPRLLRKKSSFFSASSSSENLDSRKESAHLAEQQISLRESLRLPGIGIQLGNNLQRNAEWESSSRTGRSPRTERSPRTRAPPGVSPSPSDFEDWHSCASSDKEGGTAIQASAREEIRRSPRLTLKAAGLPAGTTESSSPIEFDLKGLPDDLQMMTVTRPGNGGMQPSSSPPVQGSPTNSAANVTFGSPFGVPSRIAAEGQSDPSPSPVLSAARSSWSPWSGANSPAECSTGATTPPASPRFATPPASPPTREKSPDAVPKTPPKIPPKADPATPKAPPKATAASPKTPGPENGKGLAPPKKGLGKGPPGKGKGKGGKGPPPGGKAAGPKAVEPRKPDVKPGVQVKKLFWSSFRLSDPAANTVWNAIEQEGANIDLEQLETLFCEAPLAARRAPSATPAEEDAKMKKIQVLEHQRRRQLCVMMARLPAMAEVANAVHSMDAESLGSEQIELLLMNLPSDDEIKLLRKAESENTIDENNIWDTAEDFLLRLINVPQFQLRLKAWHFENSFEERFNAVSAALSTLAEGCECVLMAQSIRHLLGIVLYVGNFLNGGTPRGRADGFALDTLSQMRAVKMSQGEKAGTLIDYITQQMETNYPGELASIFTEQGAFEKMKRAARLKVADLLEELTSFQNTANQMQRMVQSPEHATDPALCEHDKVLTKRIAQLEKLRENLKDCEKHYEEICAWFHMEGKDKKPTDEFFSIWSKFLHDVSQARKTIKERQDKEAIKRRNSLSARRSSVNLPPSGLAGEQGKRRSLTPPSRRNSISPVASEGALLEKASPARGNSRGSGFLPRKQSSISVSSKSSNEAEREREMLLQNAEKSESAPAAGNQKTE